MTTQYVRYRVPYNAHRYYECSDSAKLTAVTLKLRRECADQYPSDHASAIMPIAEQWRRERNESALDGDKRSQFPYVGLIHWSAIERIGGRLGAA